MKNCTAFALLCLAALAAAAQPEQCPFFLPSWEPESWTWMDRNCKIHSRRDLDAILNNHLQWERKYAIRTKLWLEEKGLEEKISDLNNEDGSPKRIVDLDDDTAAAGPAHTRVFQGPDGDGSHGQPGRSDRGWEAPRRRSRRTGCGAGPQNNRATLIPWNADNPQAVAGQHNVIPDVIWDTVQGALTDDGTEIIWIVCGQRTRSSGRFYECFGKFAPRTRSDIRAATCTYIAPESL